MTTTSPHPVPGWYPDPAGRHEHRWWDGARWTTRVARDGVPFDEVGQVAPTGAADAPVASSSVLRVAAAAGPRAPRRRRGGPLVGEPMTRARYWRLYLRYVAAVAVPALLVSTLVLLGVRGPVIAVLNLAVSILGVMLLLPLGIATVARLDDVGEPRNRILLALVPVVGWALLVVLLLRPGAHDHLPERAGGTGSPRREDALPSAA